MNATRASWVQAPDDDESALLTAAEEVELAKRIEAGLLAREYLERNEIHDESSRRELVRLTEDGWAARTRFIKANTGLAAHFARRYTGRGLDLDDLVQEGLIGMIHAVEKFDYGRGNKFSTYAAWWIRQSITRALANQSRTIRLPVPVVDAVNKIARARHELIDQLGRTPTPEEIASEVGLPAQAVREAALQAVRPWSLEEPFPVRPGEADHRSECVNGVWCSPFGDLIEEVEKPGRSRVRAEGVSEAFKLLTPREADVLRLRMGMDDQRECSLQEIGTRLGLSRERVRQIESQALSKLRQHMQTASRPARQRADECWHLPSLAGLRPSHSETAPRQGRG